MVDSNSNQPASDSTAPPLLGFKDLEARVEKLEGEKNTSLSKKFTGAASISALFLGLVLSSISLYDVLVTKPEADRITRVSAFNQSLNSAAKTQQDLLQLQMQTQDQKLQLACKIHGGWRMWCKPLK